MKRLLVVVTFLLLLPITSNADVMTVVFDHLIDKSNIQSIDVAKDSYFEVKITNTCADKFEAKSIGLEKSGKDTTKITQPPESQRGVRSIKENKYYMEQYISEKNACIIGEPIVLKVLHESKYGGYRIDIVRKDKTDKPDGPVTAIKYNDDQTKEKINEKLDKIYEEAYLKKQNTESEDAFRKRVQKEQIDFIEKNVSHTLNPTYCIVQVNDSPWHFDFAGGFTFSFLTDRKYGVDSNNTVYRNKSDEDLANLGFAAFLHTYNDRWKTCISKYDLTFVPLSLGLGITTGSKASYFFGPSIKLGQAFFTIGWHLGPTQALPAGVNEGSHVTDANAFNNMDTRTGGGFFFALSYTFLGSEKAMFEKPFATATSK